MPTLRPTWGRFVRNPIDATHFNPAARWLKIPATGGRLAPGGVRLGRSASPSAAGGAARAAAAEAASSRPASAGGVSPWASASRSEALSPSGAAWPAAPAAAAPPAVALGCESSTAATWSSAYLPRPRAATWSEENGAGVPASPDIHLHDPVVLDQHVRVRLPSLACDARIVVFVRGRRGWRHGTCARPPRSRPTSSRAGGWPRGRSPSCCRARDRCILSVPKAVERRLPQAAAIRAGRSRRPPR